TLKEVLEEIIQKEVGLLERIEKIIAAIQSQTRSNVYLTKLYNEMTTENRSALVWKMASDMEGQTAGLYSSFIRKAQEEGQIRKDIDAGMFAFFLDNLFIMLQFSYSCEYYKQRLMMFVGDDVFEKDDMLAAQLMKFIKGAFLYDGE
ncbi:MAG: TetR/AcrR family transcriptional regulator, partial [Clostridiales bacterium]|nr:TetR/AcrR family transcriptional regulator [Clostridiales bacterium]